MVGVHPDRPKLKDLVCELKEVDWNQLGIQLNVPRHILRNIERENPGNEPRKLSEVLQYWIDNAEPGEALWETIIMALQKIGGHKHIITSIQSKYTINPQPQGRIDHESDKIADYPRVVSRSQKAEGSQHVSEVRVSARHIHNLEGQLSKFPAQVLDTPCVNSHLIKLSLSVTEWKNLAPYMKLTLAKERGILTAAASSQVVPAKQCSEMLQIWRERLAWQGC